MNLHDFFFLLGGPMNLHDCWVFPLIVLAECYAEAKTTLVVTSQLQHTV